jgi:prophage maintenance system killer protein
MIQYYDLKFSGYISRGSQFKYVYKLFEDIVNFATVIRISVQEQHSIQGVPKKNLPTFTRVFLPF